MNNSTEIKNIVPSFIFIIIGFFLGVISGFLSIFFDFYPGTRRYGAGLIIILVFWSLVLIGILIVNKEDLEDLKSQDPRIRVQCLIWLKKKWYKLVIWFLVVLLLSPFGIFALFFYSGDWFFSFSAAVSLLWALGYSYVVEELFSEKKQANSKNRENKGIMVLKRLDKLNWEGEELPKPCIHCGTMNNPDAKICVLCGLPPFEEENSEAEESLKNF